MTGSSLRAGDKHALCRGTQCCDLDSSVLELMRRVAGGDREALRVRFVVVEARAREASTNGCLVPLGDGD